MHRLVAQLREREACQKAPARAGDAGGTEYFHLSIETAALALGESYVDDRITRRD
jgi:hypothetical protein